MSARGEVVEKLILKVVFRETSIIFGLFMLGVVGELAYIALVEPGGLTINFIDFKEQTLMIATMFLVTAYPGYLIVKGILLFLRGEKNKGKR